MIEEIIPIDQRAPDFLIVGAAKSGTTSLAHYLAQHPGIFMALPQRRYEEPSYFAPIEAGGARTWCEYLELFEDAEPRQVKGEKSVAYLYHEHSARQIRQRLGRNTRIVVLLRNPVDMTYSLWGHNRRTGLEAESFERALAIQDQRGANRSHDKILPGWKDLYLYTEWARYAKQLNRYLEWFDRSLIRVYLYEEFFTPGLPQFADLLSFLNVEADYVPDERRYNPAGGVRSDWLRRSLAETRRWKEPVKAILPLQVRQKLKNTLGQLNRTTNPLPVMKMSTREHLQSMYEPEVRYLERILGRSLDTLWF